MTDTELEGVEVPTFDQDTELLRLAELDLPSYLNNRDEAANKFGWPKGQLDEVIKGLRTKGNNDNGPGERIAFPEIEPWPDAVDGAQLLEDISNGIRRFVAMDEEAICAVAGWCLFAHAFPAFEVSPRLFFTSPEKRCGKTTTLKVLYKILPMPMFASNASPSGIFRLIDAKQPTVILDEADGFVKDSEDFRNLLNAGHEIDSCNVIRVVGDGANMEPKVFRVWAPFVIAGIGKLQSTIEDRSIIIPMRRKLSHETVDAARRKNLKDLEVLARKAARWASDNVDRLKGMEPIMPDSLHDRACDNWEPLLSVADLIGAEWPEKMRAAAIALELSASSDEDETAGVMLLKDCWQVFEKMNIDRISSKNLTEALNELEGRPWSEWRRGNPITQNGVAKLLKAFGIAPSQMKISGSKIRGYQKDRFSESYNRYVQVENRPSDASTQETNRYPGTNGGKLPKTTTLQPVPDCEGYHPENSENPQKTAAGTEVPVEKGDAGPDEEIEDDIERWEVGL